MKSIYTTLAALLLWSASALMAQYAPYGTTVAGDKHGSYGAAANLLSAATNIFVDSAHNVYVCDYNNSRIQKWAPGAKSGVTVAGVNGVPGSDSAHIYGPFGVYVDAKGNVYISESLNNRVSKWAPGAKYGVTVAGHKHGLAGIDSAHLSTPGGITFDSKGNLYVVDIANNRVQKWAPGAAYGVTVAGQKDTASGIDSAHLNGPSCVFVDAAGNVYVSDATNNRVQKWAPGAKYGTTVAGRKDTTSGLDSAHLNNPAGLFVDSTGTIYLAEITGNRVTRWAAGAGYGVTVAGNNHGITGTDSTELSFPFGLVLDKQFNIYIGDWNNSRVQRWARYQTPVINLDKPLNRFTLYPNPTQGQFIIDAVTTATTGNALIQVCDMLGNTVYTQESKVVNGTVHAALNMTDLPNGIYFVRLSCGTQSGVQKVVLEK